MDPLTIRLTCQPLFLLTSLSLSSWICGWTIFLSLHSLLQTRQKAPKALEISLGKNTQLLSTSAVPQHRWDICILHLTIKISLHANGRSLWVCVGVTSEALRRIWVWYSLYYTLLHLFEFLMAILICGPQHNTYPLNPRTAHALWSIMKSSVVLWTLRIKTVLYFESSGQCLNWRSLQG